MSLFGEKRSYSAGSELIWQATALTSAQIDPLNTLDLIRRSELIQQQSELIRQLLLTSAVILRIK